jgi:flagellin-like hook-associated protein FlgL
MEQGVVGGSNDLQVSLNSVGLGFLRENDAANGYPPISVSTQEKAVVAADALSVELEGLAQQFSRLRSNSKQVELSIDATRRDLSSHQNALSGVADQDLAQELAQLVKSRIEMSQNSALMTQAMSINQQIVNFLL